MGFFAGEMLEVFAGGAALCGEAEALAFVHRAAVGGDLSVRVAKERVVGADIDLVVAGEVDLAFESSEHPSGDVVEEAFGLPRWSVWDLLGESERIGGGVKGFTGEDGGGEVVAVCVACFGEAGDDHIGAKAADHPDHIGEDGLVSPDLQGFGGGFGVAKVFGAGKELFGTIESAGLEKFMGADHAEQGALFATDQILSTASPRKREITDAKFSLSSEISEESGVFVVGVCSDVKDTPDGLEAFELMEDVGGVGLSDLDLREGRIGELGCGHGGPFGLRAGRGGFCGLWAGSGARVGRWDGKGEKEEDRQEGARQSGGECVGSDGHDRVAPVRGAGRVFRRGDKERQAKGAQGFVDKGFRIVGGRRWDRRIGGRVLWRGGASGRGVGDREGSVWRVGPWCGCHRQGRESRCVGVRSAR